MPLVPVLLAILISVAGAVGGAMFWLARSGRLPVQGAPAGVQSVKKPEPVKTRLMLLEPLLVNLADESNAGYLRVVVALRVEDLPLAKEEKSKEEKPAEKGKPVVNEDEVMLRDTALNVLGLETSERLLAPDGKDRLKQTMREAFAEHVPRVKVADVLFTEFLVQR